VRQQTLATQSGFEKYARKSRRGVISGGNGAGGAVIETGGAEGETSFVATSRRRSNPLSQWNTVENLTVSLYVWESTKEN